MAKSFIAWAMPGVVFTVAFAFSACSGADETQSTNCVPTGGVPTTTTSGVGGASSGSSGQGANAPVEETTDTQTGTESGADGNSFHHPMDLGSTGKNPFEILKERAAEGPPEIRSRLHSCSRIPYSTLGAFLESRGVNLALKAAAGQPPTAGELYASAGDALGIARFEARQAESYFYTVAAATKLFDIFVQAAPEIIANIQNAPACQMNGVGKPLFDTDTNKCVYSPLSCLMGRPATDDDLELCNLMIAQAKPGNAADLDTKKKITVAAFLSAAHTCE